MWNLIIVSMMMVLSLSGCIGHKAIRICLPDADSKLEFEGPSSISGISTGEFVIKGRGSYLSVPMFMDHDKQQLVLEYLDGLDDCPLLDKPQGKS